MPCLKKQGKQYVAFIDFHKCFDTIDRPILWDIVQNRGIKGNFFVALQCMYLNVKSCIRCNNARSEFIDCTIGLKQGCLASPILFSLFIDEFLHVLNDKNVKGVQLHTDITQLFLLMFADDLALLSDTISGLQQQLNILSDFCNDYKLKVNENKTKVLVFKRGGRLSRHEKWTYQNCNLEVVSRFCYVGLTFTRQMSLNEMVHDLCIKGKRSFISILHSLYNYGQMPKNMFFKLFDLKICPQLLYGAEIWGFNQYEELERCQYYACKRFMCAKQNACNYFVLGECARYPMYITSTKRCLKYWFKILSMDDSRFVKKCYHMMLMDDLNGKSNWVSSLRHCLQTLGFGYVWENPTNINVHILLYNLDRRLKDVFIQKWYQSINNNAKLECYVNIKHDFVYESYLDVLDIRKFRFSYVNFRTSCHNLEIERGRYTNIQRNERVCKLCDQNVIEDEYHLLCCCTFYTELRCIYLPRKYYVSPSKNKFNIIMSSRNADTIRNLATYLFYAFKKRTQHLTNS